MRRVTGEFEMPCFAGACRLNKADRPFFGMEKVMSKQQAILETLLGAAELNGDRTVALKIRHDIFKITRSREADGYHRLARAASEPRRPHCKAA